MGCGASTAHRTAPFSSSQNDNVHSLSKYLQYLQSLPHLFSSTSVNNVKFLNTCHVRNTDTPPTIGTLISKQGDDDPSHHDSSSFKTKRTKSVASLRSVRSNSTILSIDPVDIDRHVMVFSCTDTRSCLYEKIVTAEELFEIREALDVNMTIGWWQLFRAIKHCFLNRRVYLDFRPDPPVSARDEPVSSSSTADYCNMTLELHFSTLGRTSLTLKLAQVEDTTRHLTQFFLEPLFEFYGQPQDSGSADRIEQLERQVKLYREKIHMLKEKLRNPSSPTTGDDDSTFDMEPSSPLTRKSKRNNSQRSFSSAGATKASDSGKPESPVIPAGNALQFLKDMQKKLIEKGEMNEKEKAAFQSVIDILAQEDMYVAEFDQQAQKEVDGEIITWLKSRFGVNSNNNVIVKSNDPSSRSNLNFRNAVDLLQQSKQINRTTTKESILSMFNKVDDWNFDVFTLAELTEGQTLFITSYTLFTKYDILTKFRIDERTFINFLREVESGYHPNPYHNSMHAADVLQVLHCIIYRGELSRLMHDEDIFAALLSAIIHDYDHPGLNNAFQMNTQSYLATLYNDRSVLENHHCAQAFELMKSPQYNILANLTREQRLDVRETMIQMVLSTDMSQHDKYLSKFKQRLEARADFSNKEDLRLALQIGVKMADVSNPSRPQHLYLKWAERLCDEFYRQGDKERALSVTISPLMDRYKPSLAKGQEAFINYIITPMMENFCHLLPKMHFAFKYVKSNRDFWQSHDEIRKEDQRVPVDEAPVHED